MNVRYLGYLMLLLQKKEVSIAKESVGGTIN